MVGSFQRERRCISIARPGARQVDLMHVRRAPTSSFVLGPPGC